MQQRLRSDQACHPVPPLAVSSVRDAYEEHVYHNAQPSKSSRTPVPRRRYDIEGEALIVVPDYADEPKTVKEAFFGPIREKWAKAMEEEMESMRSNQVWDLVDLPPGQKEMGTNGF